MSENRREIAARKITFFGRLAARLVGWGLTPNQISIASSVFALGSLLSFVIAESHDGFGRARPLVGVIIGVQLRLVCNLIDGLMAVEGGLKTKSGEIFNDVPDRVSDVLIFMGAGYFAHSLNLGWAASLLAVLTAYVRTLGAAMTSKHDFSGPMAKQHRMFLVTLGCLLEIVRAFVDLPFEPMKWALVVIASGSLLTCLRRLARLYRALESR